MIQKLGQVMVYVDDQEAVARFWMEAVGFVEVSRFDNGQGFKYIEVAPPGKGVTSIVLHSREFVAKMAPELNLGAPSLLFFTEGLIALRSRLAGHGVAVGEIMEMPNGRSFNFPDVEGNYFAVLERS